MARQIYPMDDAARPIWRPVPVPPIAWTIENICAYLSGQKFCIYSHGTVVVWPLGLALTDAQCNEVLVAVSAQLPDFKVRNRSDGNYLVTFKGGIGAVVSLELLKENFESLRRSAGKFGIRPGEDFVVEGPADVGKYDLVAGLYARALFYLDAADLKIVHRQI